MTKRRRIGWGIAAALLILSPLLFLALGIGYIVYVTIEEDEANKLDKDK